MEQVFVVDRSAFFAGDWPQGLSKLEPRDAAELVAAMEQKGFFVDREEAEKNSAWKQLIPYCALRVGTDLFCVERLAAQGEGRLHGKLSIGIGGHINPIDETPEGLVNRALYRELDEELFLPPEGLPKPQLIGMINDDSNAVGSVHVGLACVVDWPGTSRDVKKTLRVREISKMHGGFESLVGSSSMWEDLTRFESWSCLLLQALSLPKGETETTLSSKGNLHED